MSENNNSVIETEETEINNTVKKKIKRLEILIILACVLALVAVGIVLKNTIFDKNKMVSESTSTVEQTTEAVSKTTEKTTEEQTPATESSTDAFGYVQTSGSPLNVRSGPGTDYDIIKQIPNGEKVEIIEQKGEWVKIKHNEKDGWVYSEYINNTDDSQDKTTENESKKTSQNVSPVQIINSAMAAASNAGYTWERTSKGTTDFIFPKGYELADESTKKLYDSYISVLNDKLGINNGTQTLVIKPGKEPLNKEGTEPYPGWDRYEMVWTQQLMDDDLKNFKISGSEYSFDFDAIDNPQRGSSGFSRFTYDFLTIDDFAASKSTFSSYDSSTIRYDSIHIKLVIENGRIIKLNYKYHAHIDLDFRYAYPLICDFNVDVTKEDFVY